jgi:small GTP-binding protein
LDLIERKLKVKVCLVGEKAVGKTSLIKKFVLDIFDDKYITTIGTKITKKSMVYDQWGKEIHLDLMIWDIMGQASFRSLLKDAYFYGAHGILAVADVTRPETVPALHEWLNSTREVVGDVPVVFMANKCDLENEAKVDQAMLDEEFERYHSKSFFTSAKTGDNITDAFQLIGEMIIDRYFPDMKE